MVRTILFLNHNIIQICFQDNTLTDFLWPLGHMLDTLARTSLWEVGLDYAHGTGHGVGAFLNVHEGKAIYIYRLNWLEMNAYHVYPVITTCVLSFAGPCGISPRVSAAEIPLEAGMILSDGKEMVRVLEFCSVWLYFHVSFFDKETKWSHWYKRINDETTICYFWKNDPKVLSCRAWILWRWEVWSPYRESRSSGKGRNQGT